MLDGVTAALAIINSKGTFASRQTCDCDELAVEVKGVGPIRFPISVVTARKLCSVARPAAFGHRDKTLHDKNVRDTWEIFGRQVKIDNCKWKPRLEAQLSIIKRQLGLPEDGQLVAVFDKLLVYGPGQFFAPHQDSERTDDMIGSLVVELPSAYLGGSIAIEHNGEKKVFRGLKPGKKKLALLAFYADCRHEVKPVSSGFRISLTYRLQYRGAASTLLPEPLSGAVGKLAASVKAYFSTPVKHPYSNAAPERPDRLVYLLDHEYTQMSLAWDRLKNGDRLRAAALRRVAELLDCECYLSLADVHESWSCEAADWDSEYGFRGGHRLGSHYDDWEDDEDVEDGESHDNPAMYKLEALCASDIELRHFVGPDGKPAFDMKAVPAQSEVCCTKDSVNMAPFKAEHEGWMGNYGNTVDRWYHRAAVVIWPRERNFMVLARESATWALNALTARIKAGATHEAVEKARTLVPFWARIAPHEPSAPFLLKLLKMLVSLDDAELALNLLAPFGPLWLSSRARPCFITLATRYGLQWSMRVFGAWYERQRYDSPGWLKFLPGCCVELLGTNTASSRSLALWLLEQELTAFEQRHKAALQIPEIWLLDDSSVRPHDDVLALLEAAAVLGESAVRDRLLTFLMAPTTALPLMSAGELLRAGREGRTPSAVRALGLQAMYGHVVELLERKLAEKERSADDWSIAHAIQCKCLLCVELSAFLCASTRTVFAWPLAKERRRHIHSMLDSHNLPVTHSTKRCGSPFILVLTKQKALFQRAAAERKQQQTLLSWLRKERRAFVNDSLFSAVHV
jgi:hypothetical protein